MNGGSENDENKIETSCDDYGTDKDSCREDPTCEVSNDKCITSYCTTKYGYNVEECKKNGCKIDTNTKLCAPSDEQIIQRIQKANTEQSNVPTGNLSFMMY